MRTIPVLAACLISISVSLAQSEKEVSSKITGVTVFLNKAQITRVARVNITAGESQFVITGLTANIDPQSIQVAGKGNFTLLGISHRVNYLDELNMPPGLKMLNDSLEYLQRQVVLENSQKEILNKEEQMLVSNQKIGGTNQNLTAAELKAMADFYRNRLTDIVNARMKIDLRLKEINERIRRIRQQISEQHRLYTQNTGEIVVKVSADTPAQGELTVDYVVGNAGWNAVYDLRAKDTRSPIRLAYKANVYQNTGEDWKDVRLKLSTANPTLGGVKPELATWYLDFPKVMLRGVAAITREKKAMSYMLDSAQGGVEVQPSPVEASAVSENVVVMQTSLNTEFDISLPYTVPSSAQPTLVDIRQHEVNAQYIYSAAPKLDRDAFLLARITGWEQLNLLPGNANVFFEGTFVGNSYIDPNNIPDTLSLSLGRDQRLVIERKKLRDFSSVRLIGSNKRETLAFEISVRNTKNENATIILEDQIPVSANSQIEVTLTDRGGAKYDPVTGKLTWEFELQPNESKTVTYHYEVKYPRNQVVTGLN